MEIFLSYGQQWCQVETQIQTSVVRHTHFVFWYSRIQFSRRISVILNFIRTLSGIIYCYISTISFMIHPVQYKLTYSPCIDQYIVHKTKQDIHLKCEVPATVNVYRADCSLSGADWHFLQTLLRAVCLLSVSPTENKY